MNSKKKAKAFFFCATKIVKKITKKIFQKSIDILQGVCYYNVGGRRR